MLVDKKILAGGVSMIIVGMILSGVLSDMTPIGREGMTEEEKYEFMVNERRMKILKPFQVFWWELDFY